MKGCNSWLDANGTRPNGSSQNCAKVTNLPLQVPTSRKLSDNSTSRCRRSTTGATRMRHESRRRQRVRRNQERECPAQTLLAEAELEKAALKEIARENSAPDRQTKRHDDAPETMGLSQRFACKSVGQLPIHTTENAGEEYPDDPDADLRKWLRDWAKANARKGLSGGADLRADDVGQRVPMAYSDRFDIWLEATGRAVLPERQRQQSCCVITRPNVLCPSLFMSMWQGRPT